MKSKFYLKFPFISTVALFLLCMGYGIFVLLNQNDVTSNKQELNVSTETSNIEKMAVVLFTKENCSECTTAEKAIKEPSSAEYFTEQFNFSVTNMYNPNFKDIVRMYNVNEAPTLLILGKDGSLIDKIESITEQSILISLNKVLDQSVVTQEEGNKNE